MRALISSKRLLLVNSFVLAQVVLTSACSKEADHDHSQPARPPIIITDPQPSDRYYATDTESCSYDYRSYTSGDVTIIKPTCRSNKEYRWLSTCESGKCETLDVHVHYMRLEELGTNMAVQVEAFDNQNFQGAPKATTAMFNYNAKRGEWKKVPLKLAPGDYYIRAYMTNEDGGRVPYNFGGMELVADRPVGVVGVLSGAERVSVEPKYSRKESTPVHVYLDKLFKKPGTEPETKAFLRIKIKTQDPAAVVSGKKIRIQLRQGEDLDANPDFEFTMASDLLLVRDGIGEAEFVSPSLAEGNYTVLTFVDTNDNSYLDPTELQNFYAESGATKMIEIRKNFTRTISATLSLPTNN